MLILLYNKFTVKQEYFIHLCENKVLKDYIVNQTYHLLKYIAKLHLQEQSL